MAEDQSKKDIDPQTTTNTTTTTRSTILGDNPTGAKLPAERSFTSDPPPDSDRSGDRSF